jgi:hypothetical protein
VASAEHEAWQLRIKRRQSVPPTHAGNRSQTSTENHDAGDKPSYDRAAPDQKRHAASPAAWPGIGCSTARIRSHETLSALTALCV